MLTERRLLLDSAETVAAFAKEIRELPQTSEITETRAFMRSFVRDEILAAISAYLVGLADRETVLELISRYFAEQLRP